LIDDLTKLPDELIPRIEDLPGDLAQLAMIVEEIMPGKGVVTVLRMEKEYRGTAIYFHNLDGLRRKVRDTCIKARYDNGVRVPEIARWARLSERQVWTILGKDPGEERQLKLF
jgi:Mor family transcriptional regulator